MGSGVGSPPEPPGRPAYQAVVGAEGFGAWRVTGGTSSAAQVMPLLRSNIPGKPDA